MNTHTHAWMKAMDLWRWAWVKHLVLAAWQCLYFGFCPEWMILSRSTSWRHLPSGRVIFLGPFWVSLIWWWVMMRESSSFYSQVIQRQIILIIAPEGRDSRDTTVWQGDLMGLLLCRKIELSRDELKCKCWICIGLNRKDPLWALNTRVHVGVGGKQIWHLPTWCLQKWRLSHFANSPQIH